MVIRLTIDGLSQEGAIFASIPTSLFWMAYIACSLLTYLLLRSCVKAPVAAKEVVNPLFEKRPKQFGIVGALPPKRICVGS
ncbi:hypothetical protein MKW92_014199 [Papaver armeniacum]|nr:hypothetical protein MKW92_014199 [Papaver armeniacum]